MSRVVTLRFDDSPGDPAQQGIESISVAPGAAGGAGVTVTGWYDQFARWTATVVLTDAQRAQLREVLT